MTIEQVENRVNAAFEAATPKGFKQVLESCKEQKQKGNNMENITVVQPKEQRKGKNKLIAIIAAAAAFVFIIAGVVGIALDSGRDKTFVTVQLDVNPGIEIRVDKDERVLSVTALNEEAEQVIRDLDFSGSTIEVAVNAIVGSMLKNGYLSEIANSILVSVEGKNAEASELLQKKLTEEIDAMLNAAAFNGSVLSQTIIPGDEELERLAEEYGITHGKASLILAVIANHPNYKFEDLVPMTITELNLLAVGDDLEGFNTLGTPESSSYISTGEAFAIALNHAGVSEADAVLTQCKLEYDDGRMVYDVEFNNGVTEYEYTIDASNGTVLEYESEPFDASSSPKPTVDPSVVYIGEENAIAAALKRAGINQNDTIELDCYLDDYNGIPAYEVDFETATMEYECDVDAVTGEILFFKSEPNNDDGGNPGNTPNNTPAPTNGYIGEQRAKEIAFNHAGVNERDVRNLKIKLDYEHGAYYYDIEFDCGAYEYEYEINAVNGSIYHYDSEYDDDHDGHGHHSTPTPRPNNTPKPTNTPNAGQQVDWREAADIAMRHAGVNKNEVISLSVERRNGSTPYFEVDFSTRNREYEYRVGISTGNVTYNHSERNDDCDIPNGSYISIYDALSRALSAVNSNSCSDREISIELDYDDGVVTYEVDFHCGNTEYTVVLNAKNGSIIDIERD